ncbi:DMT family transporter [Lutibacter flavus]|uniref:Permease of the drug/metabolite transporter (DMT) superfamily n=1 Tax=Lutibacter flavus TaxID=691689 RepID=A0A238X0L1_9FLAO|nr:DMT family transporter [Lutibacter flavus]SNR51419.1 Permease of the drug/metabolite transporter (DMT) superfamily [Lutibacter flavus]
MKSNHFTHLIELNIAVLLVSTSGVLGRYISMPPPITIWWRCVFAAIILGSYCWYKKIDLKILHKRDLATIIISGLLFGAHWVTYFYALHLSNVAIGMLSLFTYPVVTALLEPLFFKTKLNNKHVILGFVVLVGIYFLTPEFDLSNNYTKGILFGLVSSVFYAIRNILMKKKVANYHGSMLMFYQMVIITLVLLPVLFIFEVNPNINDWSALIALALFTTSIGHTLFVMSFKNFSISTASIMSSIQPIYGILFGLLFLNEIPASKTIIGGVLILTTVVIESYRSKKYN